MRILIADDSRAIRMLISSTLKQLGAHEVFEAENGQLALDRMQAGGVDMLFLDLHMPIIDGIELLRRLRVSPIKNNAPVIIVSSDNDMKIIAEAKQLGAIGYIRKPFNYTGLKKSLEEALNSLPHFLRGSETTN